VPEQWVAFGTSGHRGSVGIGPNPVATTMKTAQPELPDYISEIRAKREIKMEAKP
jgi:phosphoglucomutase